MPKNYWDYSLGYIHLAFAWSEQYDMNYILDQLDLMGDNLGTFVKNMLKLANMFDELCKLATDTNNAELLEVLSLGKEKIQSLTLNSIKDNKKFEINSVEMLYSLPSKSFTLINDENNNIYIAKIKDYNDVKIQLNTKDYDQFFKKENTRIRNNILQSYDFLLNKKYKVEINQVALNNVKNLFQ